MDKERKAELEGLGCPSEMISDFQEARDKEGKLLILASYRKELLLKLHEAQKKLTNLDYILYEIKQEKE